MYKSENFTLFMTLYFLTSVNFNLCVFCTQNFNPIINRLPIQTKAKVRNV